jgi:hypothetical protein
MSYFRVLYLELNVSGPWNALRWTNVSPLVHQHPDRAKKPFWERLGLSRGQIRRLGTASLLLERLGGGTNDRRAEICLLCSVEMYLYNVHPYSMYGGRCTTGDGATAA